MALRTHGHCPGGGLGVCVLSEEKPRGRALLLPGTTVRQGRRQMSTPPWTTRWPQCDHTRPREGAGQRDIRDTEDPGGAPWRRREEAPAALCPSHVAVQEAKEDARRKTKTRQPPRAERSLSTQLGSLPLGVKSTATVVFKAQSRAQETGEGVMVRELAAGKQADRPRGLEGGYVRRVTARVAGALREVARTGRARNSGTGPQRTAASLSLRTEEGGWQHRSPWALSSGGWASPPPLLALSPRTPAGHERGENQPSTPGITRRGLQSPRGAWPVDFRAPSAKGRFSRTSRGERSRRARNNAAAAGSTRGGLTAVKTISSPDSCTRPSQDEDAGRHELSRAHLPPAQPQEAPGERGRQGERRPVGAVHWRGWQARGGSPRRTGGQNR